MPRPLFLSAALALLPPPAVAHPHLFIEAGLEFVMDGTRLTGVRVTWVYDAWYTLLLFEDLGLDPDGDLVLDEGEMARLAAADADWPADYEGDLYGEAGGAPVALAAPEGFGLRLDGDRIVSTHLRPLAQPVDAAAMPVTFASYDPSYYAAFDLTLPVTVSGGSDGCALTVEPADRAAAKARLEEALRALQATGAAELQFPAVGAEFADHVRLACAAR
jgi:ABC-type uncharacterized transport system substrate-binding protein